MHNTERSTVQGGYEADYLSTLSSRELQEIMRTASSLPLDALLNRGTVAIDYEKGRIWRDCYWKGSFAKDTLMGWEERIATPIRKEGPSFAGGRFWKRFDSIRGDEAIGHIVNYGLAFLPGRPVVRQMRYPDDRRRYARAGDDVMLLTYLNQPYRVVYDLIKVVDRDNCVGVMHLGTFPDGYEFATFVMARNNYPFEKMAVPDHDTIMSSGPAIDAPAAELAGSWTGYVVFLREPDLALHNQFNPPLLRIDFSSDGGTARIRRGLFTSDARVEPGAGLLRLTGAGAHRDEIRRVHADVLVGRRVRPAGASPGLRYVLKRRRPRA